jgi:hypothetical protein
LRGGGRFCTPHKQFRRLTPKLRERTIYGWKIDSLESSRCPTRSSHHFTLRPFDSTALFSVCRSFCKLSDVFIPSRSAHSNFREDKEVIAKLKARLADLDHKT